jgi:hypothetical protein
MRMQRNSDRSKRYAVPSLLLELGKLRHEKLSDSTVMTAEQMKKQREIFKRIYSTD